MVLLVSTGAWADSSAAGPDPYIATFSIVAQDPDSGDLGVAVHSKYFAVGNVVPHAAADVGALATQARGNLSYGTEGLALLAEGREPAQVIARLTQADPLRDERQLGLVDVRGRAATYTGTKCLPWAGGRTGQYYAVQGNLLAGPEVVDAMATAYETANGDFSRRLLLALAAGQAAGGDVRGRQSAALLVVRKGAGYTGANDRYIDLHVEDDPAPIRELLRLLDIREGQLAEGLAQGLLARARAAADAERDRLARQAREAAQHAVALNRLSDGAWLALAEARLLNAEPEAAAEAARLALILNPLLKRFAQQPDSGMGPSPALTADLLAIPSFRRLWDSLPTPP